MASPAPSYQTAGANAQSTAGITLAWPVTHNIDDVAIAEIITQGGETLTFTDIAGFQLMGALASGTGAGSVRLALYWHRATINDAMPSMVIADPGDHIQGRITTYRNVAKTGNPWHAFSMTALDTPDTAVAFPDITTLYATSLIVQVVANGLDVATATTSAQANSNLTGISERYDGNTNGGTGGGAALHTGSFAGVGAIGVSTATLVSASRQIVASIALTPIHMTGTGALDVTLVPTLDGAGLYEARTGTGDFVITLSPTVDGAGVQTLNGSGAFDVTLGVTLDGIATNTPDPVRIGLGSKRWLEDITTHEKREEDAHESVEPSVVEAAELRGVDAPAGRFKATPGKLPKFELPTRSIKRKTPEPEDPKIREDEEAFLFQWIMDNL